MADWCVILGSNHHNSYGVIRSLHKANIKAIVYIVSETEKCFYRKSFFLDKIFFVKDTAELLRQLKASNYKNIPLIACTDKFAAFIDENFNELHNYFILPGCPEQGSLRKIMRKWDMSALASENGLNIPHTHILPIPLTEEMLREQQFPVIIKPLDSIIGGKNDIRICFSKRDLLDYSESCTHERVIIQEFINKEYEFQLIGVSLDYGDKIILPAITKLIRASSNKTNTGTVKVVNISETKLDLNPILSFIKATKYQGLFSVEFLHAPDGKDYFMEINFRNDGNCICMLAAGINLPQIWCNQDLTEEFSIRATTTMPFFPMFKRTVKHPQEIVPFIRDLFNQRCLMDISLKDPTSFLRRLKLLK